MVVDELTINFEPVILSKIKHGTYFDPDVVRYSHEDVGFPITGAGAMHFMCCNRLRGD
jgi:hypothetical protein